MIDLYNISTPNNIWMAIITAYLLGVVHGITPDEHTWPITFSYSIGSYSSKKGFLIGLSFSLAFTLQRAIASELAYLSLIKFITIPIIDHIVYVIVGLAMTFGGFYIFKYKDVFHIHFDKIDTSHHEEALLGHKLDNTHEEISIKMAMLHGFIAGWGFGAFALIIYTILAPSMPNAYLGWVPGFMFGIGTTTVQALIGLGFGSLAKAIKLPSDVSKSIARLTAARTLVFGGILFFIVGIINIINPKLLEFSIKTPLKIHNLHELDIGFFLVIIIVIGIGLFSMIYETIKYKKLTRHKSLN